MFKSLQANSSEQTQIQAEGIVMAYNLMGYDAVGISTYDLAGGLDFFKKMEALSTFSWLSANLVAKDTEHSIFKPQIILQKGGMTIGVIGLTGENAARILADENVKILNWQEVLPKLVEKLAIQCDMVVLLSNLSGAQNRKISKTVPGINILIQAGIQTSNLTPTMMNQTLVCQTSKQGKYLGELTINWNKAGKWGTDDGDNLLQQKRKLDRLNWHIRRIESQGDPGEIDKSKPGILQSYQNLVNRRKTLENSITKLDNIDRQEELSSTFQNQFIAMKTSLPDQPEVLKIVNGTRKKINAAGKKQVRNMRKMKAYAGSQTCGSCHEEAYQNWQQSRHGQAFQTLVNKKQQYNIDCLPCHVTGVKPDNGALALSLPANLKNVGCESCHGPGKAHVKDPGKNIFLSHPNQETCLTCHNDEHDDSFDYENDVIRLHCQTDG